MAKVWPINGNDPSSITNSINFSSEIRISAESISIIASEKRPTAICRYCGSEIEGKRCESCGAPRKGDAE